MIECKVCDYPSGNCLCSYPTQEEIDTALANMAKDISEQCTEEEIDEFLESFGS